MGPKRRHRRTGKAVQQEHERQAGESSSDEPIGSRLEGMFDRSAAELPASIRERVEHVFSLVKWDVLDPEQRRIRAAQWDAQHDSRSPDEFRTWWEFFVEQDKVRAELLEWEAVATPTAADLSLKERRIVELTRQLAAMEKKIRKAPDAPPIVGERMPDDGSIPEGRPDYLAYPKAATLLSRRLGATPEEIAGWIWCGPDDGGLRAFRSANEFIDPPRFYFTDWMGPDYRAAMMGCWFLASDVTGFVPGERLLTGKALVERWGRLPGLEPEAYIRAKIEESRLLDFHPTMAATQAGSPEAVELPPLQEALFFLRDVEAVEGEDFPKAAEPAQQVQAVGTEPDVGSAKWRSATARKGGFAKHAKDAKKWQGAKDEIRRIWASGKYPSRDQCAEQECGALALSYSTARKALINEPEPERNPRRP